MNVGLQPHPPLPYQVWTLINMRVMATAKIRIFVLDEARCRRDATAHLGPNPYFPLTQTQTQNPNPTPKTPN